MPAESGLKKEFGNYSWKFRIRCLNFFCFCAGLNREKPKLSEFFMHKIIAKGFKDLCEYLMNVQCTFKVLLVQMSG